LATGDIHYLFVDGGALRGRLNNVSKKCFDGIDFSIDFTKLARPYTKVFYYDAVPVREEGEEESIYEARIAPNRAVLEAAANVDGIHVYEGDARRRRRQGMVQKKVDIALAVDMLTHSFRKNMHRATLLTGDNDFKPLVDALVQDGMFVELWYPVDETSQELMQAADARRPLNMVRLCELLTISSQSKFCLPRQDIVPSNFRVDGKLLKQWTTDDEEDWRLYKSVFGNYVVTRKNEQNRLKVEDGNVERLQFFCRDSLRIDWYE
jgi:uncharacterized LabA/DUF88 family protein